ncbi:MAG TPA: hypothetical protein VF291_04505 [Burkholderiaceae bacterium]
MPATAAATTTAAAAAVLVLMRLMLAGMLLLVRDHALERLLGAAVQFLVADIRVLLSVSHVRNSCSLSP